MKKEGQINAILALECLCSGNALPVIRKEIAAILPGTQVIERESRALARAEARNQVSGEAVTTLDEERKGREVLRAERERMASILTPVILLACAIWIAVMGFINVRSRREEIGILRTIGVSARRIFMLFIWKHVSIGILGGLFGLILVVIITFFWAGSDPSLQASVAGSFTFWLEMAALAVVGASLLAVIAGWIPAMIASGQDPAEVLREE